MGLRLQPHGGFRVNIERMLRWFAESNMENVGEVGGKGASLGEMFQALHENGVQVPNGFTVTVNA